ncbi:MAG: FHA domain-containing protein [Archangiaceae bacterium]|nr:FHA domain-containing protein [Archangiaceae bacterium]
MWSLTINGPGYFDTAYELPEGVTMMGRADENDIVLSGDLVSRKHARITVRGDVLTVEDLGSRNGSKLNGEPLEGTQQARSGDTLQVGENTLAIRQPTTVESADTDMIDLGAGGAVKRFGRGIDIASAVILAKDVRDSVVMRVLDNIAPFNPSQLPFAEGDDGGELGVATPADLRKTSEIEARPPEPLPEDTPPNAMPIAFHSLLLLYRAAEKLTSASSLQSFLDDVTDKVMERVGATTAVVLTRHPSGVMVPAAVRHGGRLSHGEVPVSDAIIDAAMEKGQAIAVANVRDDSRFAERESVVLYGVDQVLCIPIGAEAPFNGVLYLNRVGVSEEPVEDLLDLCNAVAQLIDAGMQRWSKDAGAPQTERLKLALERFHAPAIVERRVAELKSKGGRPTLLEEKTVTVLFADLAGFTALSQRLDPQKTLELLNEFYERATRILFSFEGTVDKFMGDSVMALFGAPYSKGDDALRAVRAALGLKAEWAKFVARRPVKERCEVKVGLNTGKVLAGTVGGDLRLDYTAIGEPVNVASWLCQSASPQQVLITGKTLAAIGARFDVTPLGERVLQGTKSRIAVFEVLEEDAASGTLSGVRT